MDLPSGQAVPLRLFARELVAYRGALGDVRVFDARCPHQGAHLGYGGCIEGDDIVCPFHGWRFDGQGVHIDPRTRTERTANRLVSWDVSEDGGVVYVWHDAEGGPPRWKPPHGPRHGTT